MADLIREIKDRRILPALGVYVGSCWVLVEILDRLVERYLLSPYLTDIAFWGLYSLIPAVILIAWTHGKPGKDQATAAEKVGVPINVIATVGLLVTAFGGKDLGAAANLITVSNEDGVQETHYVPNESYRRRMAVFFFDNESQDPEQDWLQYAVTELLVQDLAQSPFMSVTSPWANFGNGFYPRIKQAGFEDGIGVPRSLMREIANDANRQYFIEGSISGGPDEFEITARVWDSQSMKQVGALSHSGWDLHGAVDALSKDIREVLEIPEADSRIAQDLPLSDTYGESLVALKDYISALNARLFDNDVAASIGHLDSALERDPDFVRAWMFKAINFLDSGDLPSSQVAIQKAQELDYRLPPLDRALVKQINYRLSGQTEKLISFLRMQVQLRDDAVSHSRLASMLTATGQLEEAKQEYLASLARDALNLGIFLQLANLEKGTGNMDAAIEYVRTYLEEKPEDGDAHVNMGDLLRDTGNLEAAEEHYLQASLLDNEPVVPMLKLALLSIRNGNENETRSLLEQAEAIADTPQAKAQVRAAVMYVEGRLGRLNAVVAQLYVLEEILHESQPPFQVALAVYAPMAGAYTNLGDTSSAREALDKALSMVQPPLDQFLAFSEASILVEEGDLRGAETALASGVAIIEQFKLEELKFQADLIEGVIARKEMDYVKSIAAFASAIDRIERSVLVGSDSNLFLPPLKAELAHSQILNGDLEVAQQSIDGGMVQDPAEPTLWVSKARLQLASGMPQLAMASVNYALAIWKNADPGFREFRLARELLKEIEAAL